MKAPAKMAITGQATRHPAVNAAWACSSGRIGPGGPTAFSARWPVFLGGSRIMVGRIPRLRRYPGHLELLIGHRQIRSSKNKQRIAHDRHRNLVLQRPVIGNLEPDPAA